MKDKEDQLLGYASVVLLKKKDSSMVQFAITKEDGSFVMKGIKPGSYVFQSTYIGYAPMSKDIQVTGDLKLGGLVLEKTSVKLEGHEVVEDHIPIQIKGDTVQYNAKAFKTEPNADVEELLKKLPGVEVDKEGNIKAHGEDVQKVLVDGKEFFGDDPKMATKNLPADAIDKIQVFDKESDLAEFTGISDGDEQKTINLKLKPDRKNGYFGDITGGGGYSEASPNGRYTLKGSINQFSKKKQLSLIGMGNNLNEQGFGFEDYVNMMGGWQAMMSGGMSFNTGAMPMNWNPKNGLTTTWAGGFNLNTDLSKKTHLYLSYFYNTMDNNLENLTEREYFNPEGNYDAIDLASNGSTVNSNKVSWKLKTKIDSSQDLTFRGNASYSVAKLTGNTSQITFNTLGDTQNGSANESSSSGNELNGTGRLQWRKRLRKVGRTLVAEVNGTYGDNTQDGYVNTNNVLYLIDSLSTTALYDTINQDQDYLKNRISFGGDFRYTEPIGKKKYLELRYRRQTTLTDLDKSYYDVDQESGVGTLNTSLSTKYNNNFTYDRVGASLKLNPSKKLSTTFGVNYQYSTLSGQLPLIDQEVKKEFGNVLPSFRLRWRPGRGKSFRLTYRTRVNQPSIEQLSPVVDNSNPLRIYIGNPDLQAEYAHTARLSWHSFNQFAFTNTYAGLSATYTEDKVQNKVTLDSNLIQYTTPVNVDYDLRVNVWGGFGAPIRPLKIKFDITQSGMYSNGILFQNGISNTTTTWSSTSGFSVQNRKKEHFDVKVGVSYTYNLTDFAAENSADQTYFNTNYYGDLTIYFLKRWTFGFSADYVEYAGEAFDGEAGFPILESSLSRTFLKSERILVKFSCIDILNQNIGFSRTTNLNFIQESTSNTLGRHFILTAAYSLKSFPGKKQGNSRRKNFRRFH